MPEIRVERSLEAPADHVFELLTDHAGYTRFRSIKSAEVLRPGAEEPNGLGAVRRLSTGLFNFSEEITAFERPLRMDYLIIETNLPLDHEGGSIRLTPSGERTDVLWVSRFEATTRFAKGAIGSALARSLDRSFNGMLSQIESTPRYQVPNAMLTR